MVQRFAPATTASLFFGLLVACAPSSTVMSGSGGTSGGSGGSASGGSTSSGGSSSGGTTSSGGSSSGGSSSGGATSSGGESSSGGSSTSGGTTGSGGATGSGGISGGASGSAGKGGTAGGKGGMGGVMSTGSGGSAEATMCNIGPAHNGNGSFTFYYIGQCSNCNNSPRVFACGYEGTEPSGQNSDQVVNIANKTYFAAIPGVNSSNFDMSKYCGACVQVSNGSKNVVVTIVDECPEDSNQPCKNNPGGHLDLSKPAFDALGFSTGNPSGTSWKFVPCPVTGNVVVRIKNGNSNELFIENAVTAIQSVSLNGQMANRQSYGAWHFNGNIPGGSMLQLTDIAGRMLTVEVKSTTMGQNQDTGVQFPKCL